MSARVAVVVFPGTNCELDVAWAVEALGGTAELVWHRDRSLHTADAVVVPGGFAHGDYLRTGAIARFSPVMPAVTAFADAGGPVLGVCNGFQILLESGLLPGAMLRNRGLKFICEHVSVRVEQTDTPFTTACTRGQVLSIPINHGEGNYFAPDDVLDALEKERRVIFRYVDGATGEPTDAANPNGAARAIAGICSERRNVVGMMPHPERACEPILGSGDGLVLFESVVRALSSAGAVGTAAR
jgi:phosphoribosylformylglycinamidine synthase I